MTRQVQPRPGGKPGDAEGITAFLTPVSSPGFTVEEYLWTFNMPTDHAHVSFHDVSAVFGGEGRGLQVVQHFFNENRIWQAASSLGAAQYCINESVAYAKERKPFGRPLAANQAIQFPLLELQTQCEMLRPGHAPGGWRDHCPPHPAGRRPAARQPDHRPAVVARGY